MATNETRWRAVQAQADQVSEAIEALVPIARKRDATALLARNLRKRLLARWTQLDAQVRQLQKRG